ncbi:hypothetical protein NMD63_06950 [Edwardsiella tarda]|uniref:hypothetical protein n=1 Tax=Edwardsiella tarda TaxID=636 RepID=UPI00351C526F
MNIHFQHIVSAMLENYSLKKENLYSLHGFNNQAAKACMKHHYADLLAGAAEAAGDYESMDEINQLFRYIIINENTCPT